MRMRRGERTSSKLVSFPSASHGYPSQLCFPKSFVGTTGNPKDVSMHLRTRHAADLDIKSVEGVALPVRYVAQKFLCSLVYGTVR